MALSLNGTSNGSLNNLSLSSNTGTIVDTARAGGIIQVVSSTGSTVDTTTTSSSLSLHTQAITPTSSSNKILIIPSFVSERDSTSTNHYFWADLYRDSTRIIDNFGHAVNWYSNSNEREHVATSYLDSPATTSSVTYKIDGDFNFGGGSRFLIYYPRLTLLEVVA